MKARILKKFEDEIHQLDRELKTELPKEIKRARELGDLRENAEYQAAKERQRLVEVAHQHAAEARRRDLADEPGQDSPRPRRLRLDGPPQGCRAGRSTIYQLVMPEDADAEQG